MADIKSEVRLGKGTALSYAVIGDSTAIGLGADYQDGIAYKSAEFLAKNHAVKLTNLGKSGATAKQVLERQLEAASNLKADIVLVAVGANDVTHLSRLSTVKKSFVSIIDRLKQNNPGVKIILTGAPAMGSVPRFPPIIKFLARFRTRQVNNVIQQIADQKGTTRLEIAETTEPVFLKQPQLFSSDKFHPNADGYAIWTAIIIKAL